MAKLNFTVGADTSEIQRKIKEVKQGLQSTANVAETSGEAINQAFRKAGTAVAAFFTLNAAKDFATQMARVRGEYQQMEIAFNTMLGSKQKADKLMNQLKETALSTPFEMMEIVGGGSACPPVGVP